MLDWLWNAWNSIVRAFYDFENWVYSVVEYPINNFLAGFLKTWNYAVSIFRHTRDTLTWLAGIVLNGWDMFIKDPFDKLYAAAVWTANFFTNECSRLITALYDASRDSLYMLGRLAYYYGTHFAFLQAMWQWIGNAGFPVATSIDASVFRLESLASTALGSIQGRLNTVTAWLNNATHPWAIAQPAWFVRSAWVYAPLIVHHLVGRGVLVDPGPILDELRERFPPLPWQEVLPRVTPAAPGWEGQIAHGLAAFNRLRY